MKVSKREKTLLVVVLLLATVCAYYLLFLKPYLNEISELKISKANNETQVQTYAQLKTNVDNLDVEIEQKKAEILEYSSDIAVGFDQPPVLVYLEDTVGEYAQKNMFVFSAPQYLGQMTISPVTITMVTTYDGLKSFIEEVTTGDYIVNVTRIESMVTQPYQEINMDEALPGDEVGEEMLVTPVPSQPKSKGVLMVENSDQLLEVSLDLEVYSMSGEVPLDKTYNFDDNSHNYGGDIFY